MISDKARNIKAILFDVDGVLTDGGIIYDDNGIEYKQFNVKDGLIFSRLLAADISLGVITGRKSKVVEIRMKELSVPFQAYGIKDKLSEFERFKQEYNLKNEEIAYIGDDINDLPLLLRCGLSACPYDAFDYIKEKVDITLQRSGGDGVFREFADFILKSQGKLEALIDKMIGDIHE